MPICTLLWYDLWIQSCRISWRDLNVHNVEIASVCTRNRLSISLIVAMYDPLFINLTSILFYLEFFRLAERMSKIFEMVPSAKRMETCHQESNRDTITGYGNFLLKTGKNEWSLFMWQEKWTNWKRSLLSWSSLATWVPIKIIFHVLIIKTDEKLCFKWDKKSNILMMFQFHCF